jgi:alkylhydroperoxidase/carboxymuconolactone decarboxylase family protein YurZ
MPTRVKVDVRRPISVLLNSSGQFYGTKRDRIRGLWRRADLSVRDRSLVTIAALAVMGDADLLDPYLRRGVEAGLTRDQIAEALTHLAFYGGWGKAIKALAAVNCTLGP